LKNPLNEIGEKDRFDVIVTNPPFGGEEEAGIQLNFPENTRASETALLFMQFVMRSLKHGGRCGVVVPNGFLFGDGVAARVKAQMLRDFNLHTIIRLPEGVFAPYTGIPTNLLFFDRTQPTVDIWFYEVPARDGSRYSKSKPMQFDEFENCIEWWDERDENEFAWKVSAESVLENGCNLDLRNPSGLKNIEHRPPEDIIKGILEKEAHIFEIVEEIHKLLEKK